MKISSSILAAKPNDYIDCISQILFICNEPGRSGKKLMTKILRIFKKVYMEYPSLEL